MLAGWKGVDAASAEDAADDVDALIAAAVNDFVTCVSDKLTLRENVDNLLTPRMLGFSQQLTFGAKCGEMSGVGLNSC
jgi:hypothetical protein